MADLFENPMGLQGFEFVEFASPVPNLLEPLFEKMGFQLVAKHRSKDVLLYRQGDINFIVNREPKSLAGYFAAEHGPSACGFAMGLERIFLLMQEYGVTASDAPDVYLVNVGALAEQQHQALRWTYIGSGMTHPKFLETLGRLSPAARDRIAEVAPAFR